MQISVNLSQFNFTQGGIVSCFTHDENLKQSVLNIYELPHDKTNKMACAPSPI